MSFKSEVEELVRDAPRECRLRRPRRISSALREAIAARSIASVVFRNGADAVYSTMLLQARLTDEKKGEGYFLLDELNPSSGHRRALEKERFILRTNANGVEIISLDNVVLGAGKYEGGIAYKIALPQELYYLQRRDAFRVAVRKSLGAEACFETSGNTLPTSTLTGRIEDLSFGGMRIVVPGRVEPLPAVGTLLDKGRVVIPERGEFECQAEVRFSHYAEHIDSSLFGLRFVDPDPGVGRLIVEIVNQLQREERKLSAGID